MNINYRKTSRLALACALALTLFAGGFGAKGAPFAPVAAAAEAVGAAEAAQAAGTQDEAVLAYGRPSASEDAQAARKVRANTLALREQESSSGDARGVNVLLIGGIVAVPGVLIVLVIAGIQAAVASARDGEGDFEEC